MSKNAIGAVAGAMLALGLLAGCGGPAGPARYDVEGVVTYDGKPVPAGRVVFEPDSAKGNQGPACYADIEDGKYASPSGKGTVGGPHVVRINGSNGVPHDESPLGTALFPEYRTNVDLPKETATHDFDVPASHK